MEKINKYQQLIIHLLEEYAEVKPANLNSQEYQIIADTQRNHFQLVSMGWEKNRFFCFVIIHFDIKPDGKIWLQVNNTDVDITQPLCEQGVPKSDIVLGSVSPHLRIYSGFAVA